MGEKRHEEKPRLLCLADAVSPLSAWPSDASDGGRSALRIPAASPQSAVPRHIDCFRVMSCRAVPCARPRGVAIGRPISPGFPCAPSDPVQAFGVSEILLRQSVRPYPMAAAVVLGPSPMGLGFRVLSPGSWFSIVT